MWSFIEDKLMQGLKSFEYDIQVPKGTIPARTATTARAKGAHKITKGYMLISPIRLRQLRVRPFVASYGSEEYWACTFLPIAKIDEQRKCNFDFSADTMETRHFGDKWSRPGLMGMKNWYNYTTDGERKYSDLLNLPESGYESTLFHNDKASQTILTDMKTSDWIDENTRHIVIDFSLVNLQAHIMSTYRIVFDYRRSALFWHTKSYHFSFERSGDTVIYMMLAFIFFWSLSAQNIFKEAQTLYRVGILAFLQRLYTYIELLKVLLAILQGYVYIEKRISIGKLLKLISLSYADRDHSQFVDFSEVAMLDHIFIVTGGALTCVCVFQIFDMLRMIRRIRSFIKMVLSTMSVFYYPVMMGGGFALLSTLLFGNTSTDFSTLTHSYLTVNQYLIKPPAIYHRLTDNHSYLGPAFVVVLGFSTIFIIVNFFIVFLNEAYSTIKKQMRLDLYKIQDKTKMEYLYDFLGIQINKASEEEDKRLMQITAVDRSLLAFIKRLRAM
ncbi:hypothetical protein RRG08_040591 [Elysia crispata]|uniref:Polycystin cation channel PKD1/PKD2 domain-containing protein n=1 Tax=Elysia crispata TaxID=231223 RepID=A0AAE0YJG9_9GAST|nr:hypothetical protein RRG08_040591 [Elysia crispata]